MTFNNYEAMFAYIIGNLEQLIKAIEAIPVPHNKPVVNMYKPKLVYKSANIR